ncbi:MAG TPA: mersacidin/lichenicidin family type 2 lantibiotic [Ktedonobacteraceae bacterium]|nr:mersacidin/lichenicidin family type 2 lantibiotic [Ktedonobacteraceae bacterium]
MSTDDIIRAWKGDGDGDSAEDLKVPANPAGGQELTDEDLAKIAGGLEITDVPIEVVDTNGEVHSI